MSTNFPQYTAQDFGTPVTPQKSNTGRNVVLLVLGGSALCLVLCCVACIALIFVVLRTPTGAVTFYGSAVSSDQYDAALDYAVCEGSPAVAFTENLRTSGNVTAISVSSDSQVGEDNTVVADVTNNGVLEQWTFTLQDGGRLFILNQCIQNIETN
jgi:hypothetical protein